MFIPETLVRNTPPVEDSGHTQEFASVVCRCLLSRLLFTSLPARQQQSEGRLAAAGGSSTPGARLSRPSPLVIRLSSVWAVWPGLTRTTEISVS